METKNWRAPITNLAGLVHRTAGTIQAHYNAIRAGVGEVDVSGGQQQKLRAQLNRSSLRAGAAQIPGAVVVQICWTRQIKVGAWSGVFRIHDSAINRQPYRSLRRPCKKLPPGSGPGEHLLNFRNDIGLNPLFVLAAEAGREVVGSA
ncbi:hypothetical protein NA56DRAFT_706599 [Hyaloscypha hepaticicola]|uniref:Uncharacterized protein n=1 Tax=Hyaloscypha hepaticicola TaxID=2082293 RepID=A0A2J6PXC2_9HELO|nr:hypothetical protein NA56DRAFT_706599 [Hyaloscypha hepaticicola]